MQSEILIRPRLNTLFAQAIKKPLTIVCADMGCGKTRAAYDFTQECGLPVAWIQITEADNAGQRLWEPFVSAISKLNKSLAVECRKLGFPDTEEKLHTYAVMQQTKAKSIPCVVVLDDFHLIKNDLVLKFMERVINNLPDKTSVILISREQPKINITRLMMRDEVFLVNDLDLNFTESEISRMLISLGYNSEISNLKTIYNDTKGWALLVGFVMRMLKNSPGYMGYISDAIKTDTAQLIEMGLWDRISERLKHFLLRLSLIKHYALSLINILCDGDELLVEELRSQNTFIRYNSHMASLHIHPLLLDFLQTKQNLLTDAEVLDTYKKTADWCVRNNFIVDALTYYEKLGDYETIVSILLARETKTLTDNAIQIFNIFANAPEEVFDRVEYAASIYIQVSYYFSDMRRASEITERFEAKYQALPGNSDFKKRMLGAIYYCRGYLGLMRSTYDDRYDFDEPFRKQYEYLNGLSVSPACWYQHPTGMWTSLVGVSRAGALYDYAEALSRSSVYLQKSVNGLTAGIDDLCRAEILFYQGKVIEAKNHLLKALEQAIDHGQLMIIHRTLFYLMRIAVFQGDCLSAEQAFVRMEDQRTLNDYLTCVINCEISISWYYMALSLPERSMNWLKETFAPYSHPNCLDSSGNNIKARYRYLINDYDSLFAHIDEVMSRESILFDRVEMLALEACARAKLNDKVGAAKALKAAYDNAAPNDIIMPFIELGKDTRSLISAVADVADLDIPHDWLKNIRRKASAYARNQEMITIDYRKKNIVVSRISLSQRENEILRDMYEGSSNAEIAAKLDLSINTVKMHISGIYNKLGARNKADVFRIAAENRLLPTP